ncbi:hypothetical protein H8A97_24620 [Bradyrhizobium sp. Arg62]|uniref:hypothetical protein n=1 Tax=Bradyrhizobium brasilense TaxID=1419277 RepID=UPI001E5C286F|nr:hypothetical protein [Bradyrhizobium brasilense]MCC8948205.1 hypothetical protein [Bradyrhizobium brasilense]
MAGPASIETTTKLASMRQLHAAIEHHGKQNWECAITLAAAAEGMLPPTDEPHFHKKVKELAASLPEVDEGSQGPNDVITWLKHGTFRGKKCDAATIDNSETPVVIWRAITKFYAVYNEVSPQMQSWQQTMKDSLLAERAAKAEAKV